MASRFDLKKLSRPLRLAGLSMGAGLFLFTQGCEGKGEDFYSQVVTECDYIPGYTEAELRAPCKAALERVIPYDLPSFANAPEGLKDKVTEAFYTLVAYHLKGPPQNAILGAKPAHSGAISDSNWSVFERYENPNQSAFNYVLNNIDKIDYLPLNDGTSALAELTARMIPESRNLTIFNDFWDGSRTIARFHESFIRAATILHEARHGDSVTHQACDNGRKFPACDSGMAGPYGLEFLYYEFLIYGSGILDPKIGWTPLIPSDLSAIGRDICVRIKNDQLINHVFPELLNLFEDQPCNQIQPEWVAEHEGIELPPYWF